MPIIITNIIGYSAAVVGVFLMTPQIVKSLKTKKTNDLSMIMVILYVINSVLWLIYGILILAIPVLVANAICTVIGIVQLIIKLKYE